MVSESNGGMRERYFIWREESAIKGYRAMWEQKDGE